MFMYNVYYYDIILYEKKLVEGTVNLIDYFVEIIPFLQNKNEIQDIKISRFLLIQVYNFQQTRQIS